MWCKPVAKRSWYWCWKSSCTHWWWNFDVKHFLLFLEWSTWWFEWNPNKTERKDTDTGLLKFENTFSFCRNSFNSNVNARTISTERNVIYFPTCPLSGGFTAVLPLIVALLLELALVSCLWVCKIGALWPKESSRHLSPFMSVFWLLWPWPQIRQLCHLFGCKLERRKGVDGQQKPTRVKFFQIGQKRQLQRETFAAKKQAWCWLNFSLFSRMCPFWLQLFFQRLPCCQFCWSILLFMQK